MNQPLRHSLWAAFSASVLAAALAAAPARAAAQKGSGNETRPKLTLKAQPTVSLSPARVVLTAELTGGADDYEEFYCPTVDWDWGDGTESESTVDCDPYVAGKSEIKRHFTVEHVFQAGLHRVSFRLKRNDKVLAATSVTIQVQPGAGDRD